MTWFVKCKDEKGEITSILKDDFDQAIELRDEILEKGIRAWIEDKDGRLVGFFHIDDGKEKH